MTTEHHLMSKKDRKKLHWIITQSTTFQCILNILMRFYIIFTALNTVIDYQYLLSRKYIETAWEIKDNEKLSLFYNQYI